MKYKILLVDDEPANLRMIERLFQAEHDVITAASGPEGLEMLNRYDIAVIITDQRMPGMTGIEFLLQAAKTRPQTVRIILTGYTDVMDLVEAVNSRVVYKYITKPWVNLDLRQTVECALEHFESSKTHHLVSRENARLEARIKATVEGFITAIGTMSAQNVPAVIEHSRRTSGYAAKIGERFFLNADDINTLISASLLHEVVNVEMPLREAGSNAERYNGMRKTYEQRLGLISGVPDLEEAATIIRYQHENYDGSGFFDGLSGDQIPLGSRILTIANAYDEIVSGLNSRIAATNDEAAAWLKSRSGSNFDPEIVEAFLGTDQDQFNGNSDTIKFVEQIERPVHMAV
jgi:response regulator RpfG family c-di-GMP phosphodiesterase